MILATTNPTSAQTWNNTSGGNWNVAGNWVGGTIPTSGPTTSLTFNGAASPYTATNDIGPFDLNALTFNNDGTVTLSGNLLNFTGISPTVTVAGNGTYNVSAPVALSTSLTVAGSGTGGFTVGGLLSGGTNNLIKTSAGSLTLAGGGTINQLSVQNGSTFITGGTLNLTLADGTTNTAGLQLGTATGQTVTTTISGGSVVNVFDNAWIADAAGSTATLTVTGSGTVLNVGTPGNPGATSGRLAVGNNGTGTLNVLNGAVVNADRIFASRFPTATSTVLVDGAGSTLHIITQASFGSQANGTLTIQNGGKVQADGIINLGNANTGANQTGTITVTGTGSLLSVGTATANGQLTIGNSANTTSNFNVLAGATALVTGNLFAATTGPNTANITVNGTGSLLHVTAQYSNSGGSGVSAGTVTLNVTGGGVLQVDGLSLFGQNAGGSTTSTISGTGSTFTAGGQLQIANGTNTLTIQNGGTYSGTGSVFIGSGVTGTALGNVASTITVTGTGSTFTTAAAINVGGTGGTAGAGTAALNVDGGGAITATSGLFVYSTGTVTIGAGGSLSTLGVADGGTGSAGTINVASGATLNITDGGSGVFNGVIAGAGSVTKAGAGIQTLGGTNTYSGGTIITGGTLTVTSTSALGTGNIAVGSGATLSATAVAVTVPAGKTLSGSGTVAAPLTVNGTVAPGGAPGTGPGILTVSDPVVTFASGSTFAVTLNGTTAGTGHSQLLLSGTIPPPSLTLGNATLSPTLGYTPANADKLFIIVLSDATGTISGTFNGIAQDGLVNLGSFTAQVSYTGDSISGTTIGGNDVVLYNFTPVPEPSSLLVVGVGLVGLRRRLRRR